MGWAGVVVPRTGTRSGASVALAAVLALAAVGGCSFGGDDAPALACPQPAIVDGLASVDRYRPESAGRTEDLAYTAALQNISGGCQVAGSDLLVELTVEVLVEAGPAFGGAAVELPYFVAVTTAAGQVIDRRDFTARVTVPAGGRRAGTTESFSQRFVGVGRRGAAGSQILFGFTLPRDEALRRQEGG